MPIIVLAFLMAYFYETTKISTQEAQQEILKMSNSAAWQGSVEEKLLDDLLYKIRKSHQLCEYIGVIAIDDTKVYQSGAEKNRNICELTK
jgi:hypothetical protein